MSATLYCGDSLTVLRSLPDGVARCCVTSPPYWGLRDYGVAGQLGLEATPDDYVARMVEVFREVRRVLADDGTLWLNLGDSYAAQRGGTAMPAETLAGGVGGKGDASAHRGRAEIGGRQDESSPAFRTGRVAHRNASLFGCKHKDLVGIPWRVAFALQADGWYLRSDIIWAKPNPMPESVTDRPTKAHEYVFLLSKRAKYFYDAAAIAEEVAPSQVGRIRDDQIGGASHEERGQHSAGGRYVKRPSVPRGGFNGKTEAMADEGRNAFRAVVDQRNARTVWSIATQPYPEAHFATFPEELARRCIMAGSAPGDTVLDPFGGSGTVAQVATGNGRNAVHIDLNPQYIELARQRIGPMLCTEVA